MGKLRASRREAQQQKEWERLYGGSTAPARYSARTALNHITNYGSGLGMTAGATGEVAVSAVKLYDQQGSAEAACSALGQQFEDGVLKTGGGEPQNRFNTWQAVRAVALSALTNARPASRAEIGQMRHDTGGS